MMGCEILTPIKYKLENMTNAGEESEEHDVWRSEFSSLAFRNICLYNEYLSLAF